MHFLRVSYFCFLCLAAMLWTGGFSEIAFGESHPRPVHDIRKRHEDTKADPKAEREPVTKSSEAWRDTDLTSKRDDKLVEGKELDTKKSDAKSSDIERKDTVGRELKNKIQTSDVASDLNFQKVESQYEIRGWEKDEIYSLVRKGPTGISTDGRDGRQEMVYVYGEPGKYVVVNSNTHEIVQVSDKLKENWRDDRRIRWNEDKNGNR